jgi:hypothetical protein
MTPRWKNKIVINQHDVSNIAHLYTKGKVFHVNAMKTLNGGEWLTPFPGCCTPGKEPQYPLNRRLRGPQGLSGSFGEEENLIPVLAIFGRLTFDFRESKCFLRGPQTLVEMK